MPSGPCGVCERGLARRRSHRPGFAGADNAATRTSESRTRQPSSEGEALLPHLVVARLVIAPLSHRETNAARVRFHVVITLDLAVLPIRSATCIHTSVYSRTAAHEFLGF